MQSYKYVCAAHRFAMIGIGFDFDYLKIKFYTLEYSIEASSRFPYYFVACHVYEKVYSLSVYVQ